MLHCKITQNSDVLFEKSFSKFRDHILLFIYTLFSTSFTLLLKC